MSKKLITIPDDFQGFQSFVDANSLPIFIFGADIVGKVIAELLKSHNIVVDAFIDNNKNIAYIESGIYLKSNEFSFGMYLLWSLPEFDQTQICYQHNKLPC